MDDYSIRTALHINHDKSQKVFGVGYIVRCSFLLPRHALRRAGLFTVSRLDSKNMVRSHMFDPPPKFDSLPDVIEEAERPWESTTRQWRKPWRVCSPMREAKPNLSGHPAPHVDSCLGYQDVDAARRCFLQGKAVYSRGIGQVGIN